MANLKILTFGAGAVGTYIGGSLALAGEQLVFMERPEVVEELRKRGLRLDLTLDKRRNTKEAYVLSLGLFCHSFIIGGGPAIRSIRRGDLCAEIVRYSGRDRVDETVCRKTASLPVFLQRSG